MNDDLVPRKWKEGEEAEWIADWICSYGDLGQDAARVLRQQVKEIARLTEIVNTLMYEAKSSEMEAMWRHDELS